ncbi:MAG: VWA domain-containing protein [Ruminococcaceae bacterium]|nr:VWA domain-containing protein [Oscillospiraceae bacterium]
MKKVAGLLLTLLLMLCFVFAVPVSANAASADTQCGLQASIVTDKNEYKADEEIEAIFTITNTNDYKVEGVTVEPKLSDGLFLDSSDLTNKAIALESEESYSAKMLLSTKKDLVDDTSKDDKTDNKKDNSKSPKTNDTSKVVLWIVFFVISAVCIFVCIKYRKSVKVLSVILCIAMAVSMAPLSAFAAETEVDSFELDKIITVDKKEYSISMNISIPKTSSSTDDEYTVSFELNYENADNNIPDQIIATGECAVEPVAPDREGYYFVGWYLLKDDINYDNGFDFEMPVSANITLYAGWVRDIDTDQEGLLDDLEKVYGTDINKQDTDNDGLSDYLEVFSFGTDPTLEDTDNNGVTDGDEDFDCDALTNALEIKFDTDPFVDDTDKDDLTDGEEINKYHTDPLEMDTDADGVSDGKEIELGTDPTVAQTSFDINLFEDSDDKVKPSVEINLSGEQVETLSIDPFEDDNFFPETMPGYMGKAYDFSVDGEFEEATISFEFDESVLSEESDPVICYFNEETQELEELKTTINGNKASAVVEHFSKYILIDRKIYNDSFTWTDVWDSNHNYSDVEIVFVIDDSGSMDWNDPSYERLNVARNLIDDLPTNSKIGLVRFDGDWPKTEALTKTLTTNKEEVKNYLTRTYFYSPGGTDMYNGIQKAFPLYESTESTTLKIMIVLSDGETDDTYLHSSVVNTANDSNIRIYTVGLGSDTYYFNEYLNPLAVNTGGAFYLANNADELAEIYKQIGEKIDIETDGDHDGIPDYYEDNMLCFNGVKLALDKDNPDTDGDGIEDGKEVEIKYEYNEDKTQVTVTGKLVLGNPTKVDSDGDGYNDATDFSPLREYKTPIILLHGLNSNTDCFGVITNIEDKMNDQFDQEVSNKNSKGESYAYANCTSHYIREIKDDKLGGFLRDNLKYLKNKNLFAFNYPNQDMVQYNGKRLSAYIDDLILTAKSGKNKGIVDPKYIFATKNDYENNNVKFILIGHSMGGLVSRYYVENIGSSNVEKVITIDTPHYGSGMANASDALANTISFCPSIYDLDTDSTLYGGSQKTWDICWRWNGRPEATRYALRNQSPKLKEAHSSNTHYYAIGGYNVNQGFVAGEINQLAEALRYKVFSFEFGRDTSSKSAYKNSINDSLKAYSLDLCGQTSKLDLGNDDGDNTVDYMSQFGVRFKLFRKPDSIDIRRTSLVVDSQTISNRFDGKLGGDKVFHNRILNESILFYDVKNFINDPI